MDIAYSAYKAKYYSDENRAPSLESKEPSKAIQGKKQILERCAMKKRVIFISAAQQLLGIQTGVCLSSLSHSPTIIIIGKCCNVYCPQLSLPLIKLGNDIKLHLLKEGWQLKATHTSLMSFPPYPGVIQDNEHLSLCCFPAFPLL